MASQDRSIERVRDLDRLMVRVSAVFLAITFGFAPTWIERVEKIPGITDVGKIPLNLVFLLFALAFLISFGVYITPWTINRKKWLWRAVAGVFLVTGAWEGLYVLFITFLRPEELINWPLQLGTIVVGLVGFSWIVGSCIRRYLEWALD